VVEGLKLLQGALAVGAPVESVFVDGAARQEPEVSSVLADVAGHGIRVFVLAPDVLARVADTVTPQPVLAVVGMPAARLDQLEDATFVVVCVDVRDPGNAGTVIRVADAAGADGVVCCDGTVDPFNPKTVRASAGSVLHLPVVVAGDARSALDTLRAQGMRRVAALTRGGEPYTAFDAGPPLALVLGNEARGLPPDLAPHIDAYISIPMTGRAESLNVSTAAAVLCFDVARRRSNLHDVVDP
jgi:RNA methyltransferase, TrmH family